MKIFKNLIFILSAIINFNAYSQENLVDFLYNNKYLFNEQNLIWIDDANYTTQVSCVNFSTQSEKKVILESLINDSIYKFDGIIPAKNGNTFFIDKLDDFKKKKGKVTYGTLKFWLPYEIQCSASYIAKNNNLESNFTLENKDIHVSNSYFIYKSNSLNYDNIKSLKTYIYNISDKDISGNVFRYDKKGRRVSNLSTTIKSNSRKVLNYTSVKDVDFLLEFKFNNDTNFITYVEIEYSNGFKQIMKPNKFFSDSSLLLAKGEGVFANMSETPKDLNYQIYKDGQIVLEDAIKIPSKNMKVININKKVNLLKIEDKLLNLNNEEFIALINDISNDFEVKTEDLQEFIDFVWKQKNNSNYNTFISTVSKYLNINHDESDYIIKFIVKDDSKILGHIERLEKHNKLNDIFIFDVDNINDNPPPLTISKTNTDEMILFNNTDKSQIFTMSINNKNINITINSNDIKKVKLNSSINENKENLAAYIKNFSLIKIANAQENPLDICEELNDYIGIGTIVIGFVNPITAGFVDIIYILTCDGIRYYVYDTPSLLKKFKCPEGYFPENCDNISSCNYTQVRLNDGGTTKVHFQCKEVCTRENLERGGTPCHNECCDSQNMDINSSTSCVFDPAKGHYACECSRDKDGSGYHRVRATDGDTKMIGCCPLNAKFKNRRCSCDIPCGNECCLEGQKCELDIWKRLICVDKCPKHSSWNKLLKKCICDGAFPILNDKGECYNPCDTTKHQIYDIDTKKCVCMEGFPILNDKGECYNPCAENEKYDKSKGKCVCDDDRKPCGRWNKCCGPDSYCINDTVADTYYCGVCKDNERFDESKQQCVCKNGQGRCQFAQKDLLFQCCPENQFCNKAGNCEFCPKGSHWDKDMQECICDTPCGDSCCVKGTQCNPNNNTCIECGENMHVENDKCVCDSSTPIPCGNTCCKSNSICVEEKEEYKCVEITCQEGQHFVNVGNNVQSDIQTSVTEQNDNDSNNFSCGECICDIPCGEDGKTCCSDGEQCTENKDGKKVCISCLLGQVIKDGECTHIACSTEQVLCGSICCGENQFCNSQNQCEECKDGTKLNPSNNSCEGIILNNDCKPGYHDELTESCCGSLILQKSPSAGVFSQKVCVRPEGERTHAPCTARDEHNKEFIGKTWYEAERLVENDWIVTGCQLINADDGDMCCQK